VAPPIRISVKVKPRASRSRIVRAEGLSIEASLTAPPVDGAANAELLKLLAQVLDVPKSALRLVLGETSKHKVVEVGGLDAGAVIERLTVRA
jgi:uncharacterized protein (TIGR00251 family)